MSANIRISDWIEQIREPTFVVLLMIGALVFALGVAFLIIGIAINTAPPAPYVTPADKRTLIAISIGAIVIGVAVIRVGAKFVGW